VTPAQRTRVWDLPTRVFHWALAVLAVFSFTTGKAGGAWMEWHLKSGYTILTLLLFRLAWGFAGSTTARFGHFVRGPGAAWSYARSVAARTHARAFGHNPLGGWMVVVMLLAFAAQAISGLFSDDEISTQGPLAAKVSNAMVSRMSALHSYNEWLLVALVAMHVIAIATYTFWLRAPLVGAMVHGWTEPPPGAPPAPYRHAPAWRALVLLALAAAFVYWLVVVYPKA
jgi:cytochrome b